MDDGYLQIIENRKKRIEMRLQAYQFVLFSFHGKNKRSLGRINKNGLESKPGINIQHIVPVRIR